MQYSEYLADNSVIINIDTPVLQTGVSISTISYSLYDTNDTVILENENVALATVTNGVFPLTISASYNSLPAGTNEAIRTVIVTFVDSNSDTHLDNTKYILKNGAILEKLTNSFGTLNELILKYRCMPHVLGLDAVEDTVFSEYAVEAWKRLTRLNYRYKIIDSDADQLSYLTQRRDGYVYIKDIALINQDEYDSLPTEMKEALIRAQVVEAAELIAGDPIEERRNMGIISETIGESKMFFNARPPLKFPVSRKTIDELVGYVYWDTTITRV